MIHTIEKIISKYSYEDLWKIKGIVEKMISTYSPQQINENYTEARAVDLVIDYYTTKTILPTLFQVDNEIIKDVDVYSDIYGKCYLIKGFKGTNTTSSSICVFNNTKHEYSVDFLILVKMDDYYQLVEILQIPLEKALEYSEKNPEDLSFKISYTNKLKSDPTIEIIYSKLDS